MKRQYLHFYFIFYCFCFCFGDMRTQMHFIVFKILLSNASDTKLGNLSGEVAGAKFFPTAPSPSKNDARYGSGQT
jgi:hypothetical protein